jgi:hypothetical protein
MYQFITHSIQKKRKGVYESIDVRIGVISRKNRRLVLRLIPFGYWNLGNPIVVEKINTWEKSQSSCLNQFGNSSDNLESSL